jgi:hypothetical protein
MRNRKSAIVAVLCAVIAAGQSCAVFGPHREPSPCDERFEALLPARGGGEALEIVGTLRMDLARYRFRGFLRIVFSPEDRAARLDFRASNLFGTLEEDLTLLAGDGFVLYDRERGRYFDRDSTLAIIEDGIGERIMPRDLLGALLLALPRCSELQSAAVEYSRSGWKLKGLWGDRSIEIRGETRSGITEFKLALPGGANRYIVRLSREKGVGKAVFEITAVTEVTASGSLLGIEGLESR